ncbi:MAG: hypothetical protein RI564_05450 [Gracilimonas sp.]|nr:hypothetical protein [Gracilimonas sp.]
MPTKRGKRSKESLGCDSDVVLIPTSPVELRLIKAGTFYLAYSLKSRSQIKYYWINLQVQHIYLKA